MAPVSPVFYNFYNPVVNNKKKTAKQNTAANTSIHANPIDFSIEMKWLQDSSIKTALSEVRELEFDKNDLKYLSDMGVYVPFQSGRECINFIEKENIRIMFGKPGEENVHAQYEFSKNTITINEKYRGTKSFPVILAIGEAILHEAGHAKDDDGDSSIQEELNFLGMNAVAHRAFLRKYGEVFNGHTEPIIKDGVSIYAKLFFDADPQKAKLIQRMRDKYGDLPSGDRLHPAGQIATIAKQQAT